MLLAVEIILVLGALLILVGSGVTTAKSAIRLGRRTRSLVGDVEPKAMNLIERSDEAGRRALTIAETRDTLFTRLEILRITISKLLVSLRALNDIRKKVSHLLEYVGR